MNLSVGIVGLPNVGKSTLFNALLKKQVAQAQNYPFTTIEPNVGVVEVPDERLGKLAELIAKEGKDSSPSAQNDKKEGQNEKGKGQSDRRGWVDGHPPIIPAVVRFVDIAGLVKGAAQGEGLGNQFLSHIREVDAIVFVLRDFKNEDIIRAGSESPKEDLEVLKSELLLKDLETITKRIDILGREIKAVAANDPRHLTFRVLEKAKELVEQGKWLGDEMDEEEIVKIFDLQLLSTKKAISVINSDEGDFNKESPLDVKETPLRISAKLEEELGGLSEEEQKEYLKEFGIGESGLTLLIRKAYEVLGLETYFTAGPKEVRAWTIKKGSSAPEAAGVIHTDFQKGFIAADVIDWEKLIEVGGWQSAKSKGWIRTIGKNDVVGDGMVVEFRFSL